jgi:hypothetical protein
VNKRVARGFRDSNGADIVVMHCSNIFGPGVMCKVGYWYVKCALHVRGLLNTS